MKMSKSIKDYKDAMDRVKISDSFYKITETLLNDLSDEDGDKRPSYMNRKITAGIMASAACIVCLIGIRLVLDVRTDNIESAAETSLTSISAETVTEVMTTPALIDEIETEEDALDAVIEDKETVEIAAEEPAYDDSAAAEPAYDTSGAEEPAADASAAEPAADASAADTENKGDAGSGVTPEAYAIDLDGRDPVFTVPTDEAEKEGYPEFSSEGTENIPELTAVVPENVDLEITPYFDMGDVTSGEMLTVSGDEAADIIGKIKGIPTSSKKISNGEFVSLFAVQISDKETGDIFYSIYITDDGKAVITKHSSPQERTTYSLVATNYDSLKKLLFLLFGEESDYTLFENLISGR